MELLDNQMNKESEYKLLVVSVVVVMLSGLVGIPTMMGLSDLYATKQSKQVPPEKTTVQPERQSQQPSAAAPGATTRQPERQPQFSPEQQEDDNGNDAAIEQKDEQFTDVLQEDDSGNDDDDEEQIEQIEADKKAPIAISDGNIYVVWFSDQNTPNNNSEVLFRSSADGGISFSDKINLSNTTTADSIDAEIAADGSNAIVTWWEHNATNVEPVIRSSADNGVTFGPMLRLATNGTIGEG
jgi:hypothetical protein